MSDTPGPAARRALPPRDDEPVEPVAARRLAPTDPTAPASAAGAASRGRITWLAGGLAAVAAVTVAALWLGQGGPAGAPAPTPIPTLDRATLLVEPADLAGLRPGTTWSVSETLDQVKADSPQPRCLAAVADTTPKAARSWVRTLSAAGGDAAAGLHQLDHYADEATATAAYAQRLSQLGQCARTTAWLTATRDVTGVSDAAMVATYVLQGSETEFHTLLVSRSSSDINILDLTSAKQPVAAEAAATGLAALASRQCQATGATCPTTAAIADTTPPVTDPPGWLAPVDLPRLTPGAGAWRGTDVATPKLAGAACEAVDLTTVAGATLKQRTYLLHDDTRAHGLGVDQAVYTFVSPAEAAAFAGTLVANVDGCAGRTATATVRRSGEGPGVAWAITQKVNGNQSALFRVALVTAGHRVLYLFANPTDTVDFTDADWQAIAGRAAARLAQLPA